MKKITIAIDGFSSCGKSTMAKDLAREIGYIYIDSGAMYRAVTLYCLENGLFLADGQIDTARLEREMDSIHRRAAPILTSTDRTWKTASAPWRYRPASAPCLPCLSCAKPSSPGNRRWAARRAS